MGKRPYYVILFTKEYDGYETYLVYAGTNWKAACDRYKSYYQFIRNRDFINEGIEEARIEDGFRTPDPNTPLRPWQNIYSYINDNDCYYVNIQLWCIETNKFMQDTAETNYKNMFPNSKY